MGKRKMQRPLFVRKNEKLETRFKCPFCEEDESVEVKVARKLKVAGLLCQSCGVKYLTHSHNLTEPLDVYQEWLDECELVNAKKPRH